MNNPNSLLIYYTLIVNYLSGTIKGQARCPNFFAKRRLPELGQVRQVRKINFLPAGTRTRDFELLIVNLQMLVDRQVLNLDSHIFCDESINLQKLPISNLFSFMNIHKFDFLIITCQFKIHIVH